MLLSRNLSERARHLHNLPLKPLIRMAAEGWGGHGRRVGLLAEKLADHMGCRDLPPHLWRLAGELHDVGKFLVPDEILQLPRRLTSREHAFVQQHASFGFTLLTRSDLHVHKFVLKAVWLHHERWDGRGYPLGLVGEQIPLPAQIVALADWLDAVLSPRPYKGPIAPREAKALLEDERTKGFSSELVTVALTHFDELVALHRANARSLRCWRHSRGRTKAFV